MTWKTLSLGGLFLLPLLISAWAADITGNWMARVPSRHGTVATVFSFKVNGTKLTGRVTDPQGKTNISEGKIKGNEISFVVVRSFEGSAVKQSYRGKVALNEITFTREVQGGTGHPQQFIAKREFPRNGDIPVQRKINPSKW